MAREIRPDADYEIESLTKGLIVLEALEGTAFEPVPLKTVIDRTGFSRDVVMRTLKTLRLKGYAVEVSGKWSVGQRLVRLAGSIERHKGVLSVAPALAGAYR